MWNFAIARSPEPRRRRSRSILNGSGTTVESLDLRLLPSAAIYPRQAPQPQAAPPANFDGVWRIQPPGYSILITQAQGSKKATVAFAIEDVPDAKAKIKGETITIKGKYDIRYTIILTLQDPSSATGTYSEGKNGGPTAITAGKIVK